MTALSFVWVHPYSQISGCDIILFNTTHPVILHRGNEIHMGVYLCGHPYFTH